MPDNTPTVIHPFQPIYNSQSRILILGTIPSVKSRENGFYYGHPQNRFWKMLAEIFDAERPVSIEEKTQLILGHHLALWDVLASCSIENSSDASIKNAQVNDLSSLLKQTEIKYIFCNGKKAAQLYQKYQQPQTGIICSILPSTSPANAACHYDQLVMQWREAFAKTGLLSALRDTLPASKNQ